MDPFTTQNPIEASDLDFSQFANWDQDFLSPICNPKPLLDSEPTFNDLLSFNDSSSEPFGALQLTDSYLETSAGLNEEPVTGFDFQLPLSSFYTEPTSPPSINCSTPPLTPDGHSLGLMSSPARDECEGLPEWARNVDDSSDSDDSIETPSPTTSTSELSTCSPSTPMDEDMSLNEDSEDSEEFSPDSDCDMDSDYAPSECASPRLSSATKRRACHSKSVWASSSTSRSAESSPKRSLKRARAPRKSPYKQSTDASIRGPTKRSLVTKSRIQQVPLDYPCPEPVNSVCPICRHRQRNGRRPDLQRHIDAHYADARKAWMCCGVPVADAMKYRVESLRDARTWPQIGMEMVGGCGKEFARKDAYKRHLTAPNAHCYGDVNGSWVPGNKRKQK